MKKSKMVAYILKHSTCLCNKEQVEQTIKLLERKGMMPPLLPTEDDGFFENGIEYEWEPETKDRREK